MGYFYSKLELHLNFIDLLNKNDPVVKMYDYASQNFGALSFLFLALESNDIEQAKLYAQKLAPRLLKHKKFVKRVYYQYDYEFFRDHLLYFLPEKDLAELQKFLIENQSELAQLWASPNIINLLSLLDHSLYQILMRGELPEEELQGKANLLKPIDLIFDQLEKSIKGEKTDFYQLKKELAQNFTAQKDLPLPFNPLEPYIISKDRKHLLFLIAPPTPINDFQVATEFVNLVNEELSELDKELPGVKHYLTGNAAVMRDDNIIVRQDMLKTTLIAFVLIMLLFAYSFRNLSSIVFAGLCLALGLLWAFGCAYLLVGYLTVITAVFGAILLGLGIDYAILILSRYTEERHRGHTIKESLEITLTQTGKGILTGALATSLAFYSIASGTFRGGKEMGIISGTGIIIFFFVMTMFLTSLLVAWDVRRSLKQPLQRKFNPRIMRILSKMVMKAPVPIFSFFAGFFILMALTSTHYQFEYNYLNLEAQDVESVKLIRKIPKWFGISTNFGMILSENVEQDRKLVKQLQEKPTVALVDAISNFIPEINEPKIAEIEKIKTILINSKPKQKPEYKKFGKKEVQKLNRLLESISEKIKGIEGLAFLSDLENIEKQAHHLRQRIDNLRGIITSQKPELTAQNLSELDKKLASKIFSFLSKAEKVAQAPLPNFNYLKTNYPQIVERYQGKDGKFLIYVYPNREIWTEQNMKAVVRDLKAVSSDAMGVAVLFNRILDQLKKDLLRVSIIALCVVFVVIFLSYRGFWHTLLTMLPLVFGSISMVGIMNLLKIKFNFINIGMIPLIIGISIDYGVYVVQRWIGEGKGEKSIPKVVESTGRAVALSALTTIIGFGSIIIARYQGLSIMGKTLVIGVGCALVSAVLMLPSLLLIIEKIKSKN